MFSLVASIFETVFMVLEPAYRTYKVLKSSDGTDDGFGNWSGKKNGNQTYGRTGNRPGFLLNSRPESDPNSVPVSGLEDGSSVGPDDQTDKEPDQRRVLLTHWIVYAAFQAVVCVTRPWLPWFPAITIVSVLWLRCGGTEIVYQRFVEPLLTEHEQDIDQIVEKFDQAKNTVTTATETTLQAVTDDFGADTEPSPAVAVPQLLSPVA